MRKDDKAAFDGLLFPMDKANDLRKTQLERDYYLMESTSLQKSLDLELKLNTNNQEKIGLLLKNDDQLAENLAKANSMSTWEKAAWFAGGLLAGFLAVYAAKQITH
jgi:hypothetical protein